MTMEILKASEPSFEVVKVERTFSADFFQRFIKFLDASPKTIATYTKAIKQLALYFSEAGVVEPKREDILNFREELNRKGCKPTTIQNYITATRIFFRFLSQEGLYPNVADKVKGAKLDKNHKKEYFTASQVKSVLHTIDRNTLEGKRNYALATLLFTCGLRCIEASRANIEDMGLVGGFSVLHLQGKGRTERTEYVKLPAETEEAIREYLKARGTAEASEPLFVSFSNNSKGKRLSERSVSGAMKSMFLEAGFNSSKLTAHSARHTAVTLALLQGNSIEQAMEFARHKNIATTMIYNHTLDMAKNSCSASVASLIF